MIVKPFKTDAGDSEKQPNKDRKTYIKPRKFEPDLKRDTVIDDEIVEESNPNFNEGLTKKNSTWKKITSYLSSFSAIFLAVTIFVVLAVIAHTVSSLAEIISTPTIANAIYMFGLALLLLVLLMNIYSNISQLLEIKNVQKLQEKLKKQKEQPTEEIVELSLFLCNHYEKQADELLQSNIDKIKENLNSSHIYSDIYTDIDELLLKTLDKKAKLAIKNASLQTAFSTAASPVPIIDMFLIIWRSFRLTREIATIYGFRPGALTSFILLKQGAVNVVFAGVSELMIDVTNDALGATVVNKISQTTGQGIVNGVLIARLGYGIIDASRPINLSINKVSIVRLIVSSLIKSSK